MSRYNLTQESLKLNYDQDNILEWLDNTQELYNKLQQANKESIEDNLYYNKWYIEQNSIKIKAYWVNYVQVIKATIRDINSKLEEQINISNEQITQLAKYLYMRELHNYRFNYQTGLDALKTQIRIVGN